MTNIRGLEVHDNGGADLVVNSELGLATIGGVMKYVASGSNTVTAASSGKIKLGIYQVNSSGATSIIYGAEAIPSYAAGVSLSGFGPANFTSGGSMNVTLDSLGTNQITVGAHNTVDHDNGPDIAADIQSLVNASFSYSGFAATYGYTENTSVPLAMAVGSTDQIYSVIGGGAAPLGLSGDFASLCYLGSLYILAGDVSSNNRIRKMYAVGAFPGSDLTPAGLNRPYSMVSDGTHIWVGNQDNTIIRMDISGVAYGSPIVLTAGSKITNLLYDGTYIWALCNSSGSLSRILASDPTQPIYDIFLGGNPGPGCLAFDGTYIWCATSGGANQITKISRGDSVTAPSIFGSDSSLVDVSSIVYDGASMWGVDRTDNQLYKIASDFSTIAYPHPWGSAYSSPEYITYDGSNLFIALTDNGGAVAKVSRMGNLIGSLVTHVGHPQVLLPFFQSAGRYTLTSGTSGANSKVHVTTYMSDPLAANLSLGVPNGGTEIDGSSSISVSYPVPDANNILLAYLFGPNTTANVPITDSTNAVTDDNISDDVAGRQ